MTADLHQQLQSTLGSAFIVERELGGGGMSRVFPTPSSALDYSSAVLPHVNPACRRHEVQALPLR
jgi:hypothetical protein